MSEFDSGTIIDGRYRVLHRLGAGGMADVYLAQDEQLDREVALKLLHRRFAEDPRLRRALPARGAGGRVAAAPQRRQRLRPRQASRAPTTSRWSTCDGRTLKRLIREEAPLETEPRDRPHDPDAEGGALRAPARCHPPRPQAAQRDRRRQRPRQGHRLRDRSRRRLGHDRDRLDHGHRPVSLARAGAGPRGQRALGPLLDRRSCSTRC